MAELTAVAVGGVLTAEWFGERCWSLGENFDLDEVLERYEGQRVRITFEPIVEEVS